MVAAASARPMAGRVARRCDVIRAFARRELVVGFVLSFDPFFFTFFLLCVGKKRPFFLSETRFLIGCRLPIDSFRTTGR